MRSLQGEREPYAAGILFENDVGARVAKKLAEKVVIAPAFEPISEELFEKAKTLMFACEKVIDAGTPVGTFNEANGRLLALAREKGLLKNE
jgi:iron complex transport system ATP-binding protein